jgi:hypothetical protein
LALNASTTLPYDVETVTGVFTDEGFLRHTSERVGGTLQSAQLDGPATGTFTLTVVRTMPTTRLPDFARKFVGETLTLTQTERWAAPLPDGTREAKVEISIAGVPISVNAVQRLTAEGGSTRVEVDGDVASSIPFLGGKIAGAAEPVLGKALNVQGAEARRWLESR